MNTSARRLVPAVAGLVVAGAVVALNALPASHDAQSASDDLLRTASSGGSTTYPGANVALAPAPTGAAPSVTAAGALQAYSSSGVFPGAAAQSSQPVDVRLVQFSDNTQGEIQADGTVKLTYQNLLAWAVIYHGVPYQGVSSSGQAVSGAPVPEDIVAVIDADSGKLLEAFADTAA